MTSPGDRTNLPLEEEPLPFLHPREAGTSTPVHTVGAREGLWLEEEPAEWIDRPADARPALRGDGPTPRADRPGGGDDRLPATGPATSTGLAIGSLAAAWLLRRRTTQNPDAS